MVGLLELYLEEQPCLILSETDGHANWRKIQAEDLSRTVQERLVALQNPKNCDSVRKLICNLNIQCGYGCQTHHAIYCLIVAFQSNRTLMFDPDLREMVKVTCLG